MDVEVKFNRSRKKILYMHLELYVGLACALEPDTNSSCLVVNHHIQYSLFSFFLITYFISSIYYGNLKVWMSFFF